MPRKKKTSLMEIILSVIFGAPFAVAGLIYAILFASALIVIVIGFWLGIFDVITGMDTLYEFKEFVLGLL